MNKESLLETICLLRAVFVLSGIASLEQELCCCHWRYQLTLDPCSWPVSHLFSCGNFSFLQQLLNCTFSAVLDVSGILLFSSNTATQLGGGDDLTDSPLAVLVLGKLLWGYICCRRCQALWFLCAGWRVYPKQFTNPVTSKETPLQIGVAEFDHWQPH